MSDTTIEIAVFDLAGTTVKEDGVVEAAVRSVTGSRFDADLFRTSRGASKRDMLAQMIGESSADAALADFDVALISEINAGRITPLPHAEASFALLRDTGVKIVLITGFSEPVQHAILQKLGWEDAVDLAISPTGDVRGRPYPDLLLTAALALHATSVSALAVVGDTTNDVLAARRSGASICAAVQTGAHSIEMLRAAEPTDIFDHVGSFATHVLGRNGTR